MPTLPRSDAFWDWFYVRNNPPESIRPWSWHITWFSFSLVASSNCSQGLWVEEVQKDRGGGEAQCAMPPKSCVFWCFCWCFVVSTLWSWAELGLKVTPFVDHRSFCSCFPFSASICDDGVTRTDILKALPEHSLTRPIKWVEDRKTARVPKRLYFCTNFLSSTLVLEWY